jgi:hypothetical protein
VGMRGAARAACVMFLTVTPVFSAGPAFGSDDVPAAQPSSMPSPPAKPLNLGPYVDPYGPVTAARILDVPHFETRVEVHGKAMDAAALTARMEWWMRDFEPLRGAVPHQGSAPSVQEMAPYRPHVTPGLNLAPIIDWLVGKLNKKP